MRTGNVTIFFTDGYGDPHTSIYLSTFVTECFLVKITLAAVGMLLLVHSLQIMEQELITFFSLVILRISKTHLALAQG